MLQISQLANFEEQIERYHKTKVKKKSPQKLSKKIYIFFLELYSHPQQAALGLFWATIVAHSSVRVN